jgi:uncharacterized damage-inducible protein DinB
MNINKILVTQFKKEAASTKRILEKVPFDQPEWKPHEKSMTIQRLASHIAEIPQWMDRILSADSFDMSALPAGRFFAKDILELLQRHQENVAIAVGLLEKATEEQLQQYWKLKLGDKVFYDFPRVDMISHFVVSHAIHHRGQLSVYLRLNNIPVPGMYGPSADEK